MEKQILRAMIVQGVLPMISMTPSAFYILFVNVLKMGNDVTDFRDPLLGYSLLDCTLVLVFWNGFLDAIATLFVIRAYKQAVLAEQQQ